jgi:CRP-like cAMP-binding protein
MMSKKQYLFQFYLRRNKIKMNVQELPAGLRDELVIHLYHNLLVDESMFAKCDPAFIRALLNRLRPTVCLPNELIVTQGDAAREMFFLRRGVLSILEAGEEGGDIYLEEGSIFGESALLSSMTVRTHSVKALSHCDLLILDEKHFKELLRTYPGHADIMKQYEKAKRENLTTR